MRKVKEDRVYNKTRTKVFHKKVCIDFLKFKKLPYVTFNDLLQVKLHIKKKFRFYHVSIHTNNGKISF